MTDQVQSADSRRFLIGHFERGSKLGIRFVLNSGVRPTVTVAPKNDEGDVAFEPRSQSKSKDEQQQIARFVFLLLLWWTAPSLAGIIVFPSEIETILRRLLEAITFILLLPMIWPVSKAVARMLVDRRQNEDNGRAISIRSGEIGTLSIGNVPGGVGASVSSQQEQPKTAG